jgi:hypothetical protein
MAFLSTTTEKDFRRGLAFEDGSMSSFAPANDVSISGPFNRNSRGSAAVSVDLAFLPR